jgi:hypothetical protein
MRKQATSRDNTPRLTPSEVASLRQDAIETLRQTNEMLAREKADEAAKLASAPLTKPALPGSATGRG